MTTYRLFFSLCAGVRITVDIEVETKHGYSYNEAARLLAKRLDATFLYAEEIQ